MKSENSGGLKLVKWQRKEAVAPEMCLYRTRTTALLRKYFSLSMELGRVPSLLGREFFRSRITSYRMQSFEDVVIFVHDVERCLEKLDRGAQMLIARIGLQEYSYEEAARLLGYHPRTVERNYPEALDRLSAVLLEADLLREVSAFRGRQRRASKKPVARVEACQDSDNGEFAVIS